MWARGGKADTGAAKEDMLVGYGVTEEAFAAWIGEEAAPDEKPEEFALLYDNWPSYQVFMSMATQWRWSGGMDSFRTGLDHNVAPLHMEAVGIKKKKRGQVLHDLVVMEHGAIAEWHAQRVRARTKKF